MDLFDEILTGLSVDERVMLATIISTTGSTPASAFSRMLVKEGGILSVGTVGGGCMEGDVILQANRLLPDQKAAILTFQLNEDDIEHGLICGGSLKILLEPLSRESVPLIRTLQQIRDDGEDCIIATNISADGRVRSKCLVIPGEGSPIETSEGAMTVLGWIGPAGGSGAEAAARRAAATESILKVYRRHETVVLKVRDGDIILEPVAGAPSLLIFGAGHVSKYVSRSAAMAGFRVTIIDDREKFANKERFPEAARIVAADVAEAFGQLSIKPSTYVVIVTRGHRHDEEILARVASSEARYIGMIGSKRKVLTTFERLISQGISPDSLERVHAPMGIDIGAATAEEIGISIVAELIAERRGSTSPFSRKSDSMKDMMPGSI